MSRRYLTVADVVARYSGAMSTWSVYEFARTGRIPHRKHPGGKRLLFLDADLDAWDDGCELEARRLPRGGRVVRPVEAAVPSKSEARRRSNGRASEITNLEVQHRCALSD